MRNQKIYNAAGKLVCIINDEKTIEIIAKGCRTIISFKEGDSIKVISEILTPRK